MAMIFNILVVMFKYHTLHICYVSRTIILSNERYINVECHSMVFYYCVSSHMKLHSRYKSRYISLFWVIHGKRGYSFSTLILTNIIPLNLNYKPFRGDQQMVAFHLIYIILILMHVCPSQRT